MNKQEATDPHLSFREKWARHLQRQQHKFQQPSPMPSPRSRSFQNAYGKTINRYVPILLLMFFLSTGFYGVCFAMPELYENYTTLKLMQAFACSSFIQLLAHWSITRRMDSIYNPQTHGTHDSVTNVSGCMSSLYQVPNYNLDDRDTSLNGSLEFDQKDEQKGKINGNTDKSLSVSQDGDFSSSYSFYSGSTEPSTGHSTTLFTRTKDSPTLEVKNSTQPPLRKQLALYWSWTTCSVCHRSRPPRCHHCPICEKCILKRDHHCFFTGVCIGVNNQRHFVAFMFWAMFTTVFGTLHMFPYIYYQILDHISYFDFLPLIALYRGLFGYISLHICVLCILFWGLCAVTLISIVFFYQIANMTLRGITSFESVHKVKVTDTRGVAERLRHVLGENWALNFVVPYRRNTKMREDAVLWPHIKP